MASRPLGTSCISEEGLERAADSVNSGRPAAPTGAPQSPPGGTGQKLKVEGVYPTPVGPGACGVHASRVWMCDFWRQLRRTEINGGENKPVDRLARKRRSAPEFCRCGRRASDKIPDGNEEDSLRLRCTGRQRGETASQQHKRVLPS